MFKQLGGAAATVVAKGVRPRGLAVAGRGGGGRIWMVEYEATTANLHNITNYCSNRRRSADSITIVIQLMLGISSIRVPGTALTYA